MLSRVSSFKDSIGTSRSLCYEFRELRLISKNDGNSFYIKESLTDDSSDESLNLLPLWVGRLESLQGDLSTLKNCLEQLKGFQSDRLQESCKDTLHLDKQILDMNSKITHMIKVTLSNSRNYEEGEDELLARNAWLSVKTKLFAITKELRTNQQEFLTQFEEVKGFTADNTATALLNNLNELTDLFYDQSSDVIPPDSPEDRIDLAYQSGSQKDCLIKKNPKNCSKTSVGTTVALILILGALLLAYLQF